MKTNSSIFVTILFVVFSITSCKKDELKTNVSDGTGTIIRKMTVYGTKVCKLPNGGAGVECVIVTDDDNCSMQTACKPGSSLVNYNTVLHKLYSEKEIAEMAEDNARIKDLQLLEALQTDGFPVVIKK